MSQRLILISAMKSKPSPLEITDYHDNVGNSNDSDKSLTTPVQPNDNVIWVHAGDITKIKSIKAKPSSPNLFDQAPHEQENGTWLGHISPDAQENNLEEYEITYIIDGKPLTQDPKIQIHKRM